MSSDPSSVLGGLIHRIRGGDPTAVSELLVAAQQRLQSLAATILNEDFRSLKNRGECDTAEILQELSCRLLRALEASPPNDTKHFMRVAAQHIRWHLIDLARRPPPSPCESFSSCPKEESSQYQESSADGSGFSHRPNQVQIGAALRQLLGELPEDHERVVDLKLVWGLTHEEIADVLEVSGKSVQRLWREAVIKLYDGLVRRFPMLEQPGTAS